MKIQSLTVLLIATTLPLPVSAQLAGLWATELVSEEYGVKEYWALRLETDGRYERVRMRDAPTAYRRQVGTYRVNGDLVELVPEVGLPLGPTTLQVAADGDTLRDSIPEMILGARTSASWELLAGTWLFEQPGSLGARHVTFGSSGYETDVESGYQTGPFHAAGDGLVLWPELAWDPGKVRAPQLWLRVRVTATSLVYQTPDGAVHSARRAAATAVEGISWGSLKSTR